MYTHVKSLPQHYRANHVDWKKGMTEEQWGKNYTRQWRIIQAMVASGVLTYAWKMKHGRVEVEDLMEHAREWNQKEEGSEYSED